MLQNNHYEYMYRSFDSDFEKDFFYPSYSESILVNRASGYFNLSSLILSIEGIIKLLANDGCINLICNPNLSESDIAVIDACTSLDVINTTIINSLLQNIGQENSFNEQELKALDIICNMISENKLVIKIAFTKKGIYHEKFGLFYDDEGNIVYFNGSANQTSAAVTNNFESFQVSASWIDPYFQAMIQKESDYFSDIWQNKRFGINVIDFPEAVKMEMFHQYKRSSSLQNALNKYEGKNVSVETINKKVLYPYQERAIEEFVGNQFCHFYEMATGTGKTFTAIKTIERLRQEIDSEIFTLILVPQIDLQAQWEHALKEEGYEDVYLMGGGYGDAIDEFNKAVIQFSFGDRVICVSVYETFFSKLYNLVDVSPFLLIVDEAHNISVNQFNKLPKADFRLGLSATIKRFNEIETGKIIDYFTEGTIEPFYYGIEEAIENGFLSRYNYYPLYVSLTEDEFKTYQKFTIAIATEINKPKEKIDSAKLERLKRDRSLVVKQAVTKIDKLKEIISQGYDLKNSVVYCGQGKDKDSSNEATIIDVCTKIIGDSGLKVSQFTSKTLNRKEVLENFETGYYDTLVAIRCFDEGVDVPKLDKIYIMASEGALRQTVQRRGRVLRRCKETGKTIAKIYDMVVLPQENIGAFDSGAPSLVKNEFRRAYEYNRLAENKEKNLCDFELILNKFNLSEEDLNNDETTD